MVQELGPDVFVGHDSAHDTPFPTTGAIYKKGKEFRFYAIGVV